MSLDDVLELLEVGIDDVHDYFEGELAKIQTGRAQTASFEKIRVEVPTWEGTFMLREVGTLALQDALTVVVVLFDGKIGKEVERSLMKANLGVSVGLKGDRLFLTVPPLSGERREELVKMARGIAEEMRIRIRHERRDARDGANDLESEIGEDAVKRGEDLIEERVARGFEKIEELLQQKTEAILGN
ncbi:ribosome-recycling factor [bacterium]|nr:ribosome-recycling factor [bacterium]